MKKRFVFIAVALIGVIALIFLFTSGKSSTPTKAEHLQRPSEEAGALYNKAGKFAEEGELLNSRRLYKKLLTEYPESNLVKDARAKLDELNIKILFSPVPTDDSIFYEVKPGDTLSKIAGNFGTTTELIMKSNNLTDTIIRPEMRLKISKAKYSILIDKSQNMLMLKADDEILKTYTVSTGTDNSTPTGIYNIKNKLINPTWYKTGAVIPPESPENILGSRWIGLTISGYGIHGTTDETTIGEQITAGCVRMKNRDVEELYSIIPAGADITIID